MYSYLLHEFSVPDLFSSIGCDVTFVVKTSTLIGANVVEVETVFLVGNFPEILEVVSVRLLLIFGGTVAPETPFFRAKI